MIKRPRRLRSTANVRALVRETHLNKSGIVYTIFVVEGEGIKREFSSLKDCYHYSVDMLDDEIKELKSLGINSVMLFGIPELKDEEATSAYDENGIVQKAIRRIKSYAPDFYVITDVCMCQYTTHGHCGIISEAGEVLNDVTIDYIAKIALSHVKAGADMVAPSDMMDGRIGAIRSLLDESGFYNTPIMAYSAKYASAYYGPFRVAASSAPGFGDRKTYQMDFHNTDEALREVELDIEEGADIVMVKPAMSYMDVISRVKSSYNIPVAAYNVSGEYAMLKMAVEQGIMNESVIYETMVSIKRAGADIIITYFAKDIAKML